MNLYAYCANNPVGYEDPSGHQVCPTQKAVYSKYRKQGMSKKEAYEAMKKELGIGSKSGYKDSGTSPDFGKKGNIGTEIKAEKNFKDHFIRHKSLLEKITGKKYSKYKTHGQEFLNDIRKIIEDGTVKNM